MWWMTMAMATTLSVRTPRTVVGPDEPVWLRVEVRNPGAEPVRIPALAEPACALVHWVEVALKPSGAKVPACPPGLEELAAGQRKHVDIRLDEAFDTSDPGTFAVRPRPAFLPPAVSGSKGYWPGEDYTIARRTPVRTVDVVVGGSVELPAGVFTFAGHSHKSVEPDQESPLMIGYSWAAKGGEPVSGGANLHPGTASEFDVGPYRFVLLDHAYGERMRLLNFPRD